MSLVPDNAPRFEEMEQVVKRYVRNENPTQIARELGLRRVDVLNHIEDWKKSAVGSEVMKERVEELIATTDKHYSTLIQKSYEVIEEVDAPKDDRKETMTRSQMLSQKMNAIKTIADLEAKRIDMLQKSGMLEAADMGEELARMEEEMDRVMDILEKNLCSTCQPKILGALAEESQTVVVVMSNE